MPFYQQNGHEITQEEWVNQYEPYYFLGGPTHGHRINSRNQGSRFVEERIEQILINGLSPDDIPLIIAWKIGAIDHQTSECQRAIVYKNNFNIQFIHQNYGRRLINARNIINYCQQNFDDLMNNANTEELFNNLCQNSGQGIGPVYCISLLYFFTQGKWPIYDQYAHMSLNAIVNNIHPGELNNYRPINSWNNYWNNHRELYVNKIIDIFGNQQIQRNIDRSLWVYGHFFHN